jgi:hypothetical protein
MQTPTALAAVYGKRRQLARRVLSGPGVRPLLQIRFLLVFHFPPSQYFYDKSSQAVPKW